MVTVEDTTDIRDLLADRERLVRALDARIRRHVADDPDWLMLTAGQAAHLTALIHALRTGEDLPAPPTGGPVRSRLLTDGVCIDGHPATPDNVTWARGWAGRTYPRCRACHDRQRHRRTRARGGAR